MADPADKTPPEKIDPPKAEPAKAAPPVERKINPQSEMHFHEHGWKQTAFDCIAAAGVRPEDVLARDYWAHVAQRNLSRMTKIHVMADDGSWYGELLVWQTFSNGATVSFVSGPHFLAKTAVVNEEKEFDVFYGGLSKKWCVRRMKDGRNLLEGHETDQEANAALRDWLKAQGSRRAA